YTSLGGLTQSGLGLGIGSSIDLRDPQRSMLHTEVRIVGVLDDDASLLMSGVLLRDDSTVSLLSSTNPMVWIDVQNDEESVFIAESLQGELGADGATVLVVEELFDQIRIILVSLLGLVRAFLAIGLLVGIIGLAVVTNRSLKQRNMQIGVMRAIGFQPREVFMTFGLEVLWTSGVGVISGGIVGFLLHWLLHKMIFANDGGAFVIPILEFVMIPLFAILFSLIATSPSLLRSTKSPPHSVMRSMM
ncbi:MAG TPA: ABC transporter permease, partial [Candidatus Thalassarchaeaceae archaeon]